MARPAMQVPAADQVVHASEQQHLLPEGVERLQHGPQGEFTIRSQLLGPKLFGKRAVG